MKIFWTWRNRDDRTTRQILLGNERMLLAILQRLRMEGHEMSDITDALDALKTKVAGNTSVIASAEAAMDGLSAKIADLAAQVAAGSPVTAQQLNDLSASLQNDDDGLAASIVKNTPAAP